MRNWVAPMKIICLFADRHGPQQDLLLDGLIYGLARTFGSANVTDVFHKPQYKLADPEFHGEWPFNVGSTSWYAKPEYVHRIESLVGTDAIDEADAIVLNIRFLQHAVREGVCDQELFRSLCNRIDPQKTIMIDSSDSPIDWRGNPFVEDAINGPPALFCCRPGAECNHRLLISVPIEHIWRVRSTFPRVNRNSRVVAILNDNGPTRRAIMERLVQHRSKRDGMLLCWGSGSGYTIEGTEGPIPPASYYEAIARADVCVAARGAGIDTLRQSEAMAIGACLITDDFGCDAARHDEHVLYYDTPDQAVEQVERALSNDYNRLRIAMNGKRFYLDKLCPEQQALGMVRKAGLL